MWWGALYFNFDYLIGLSHLLRCGDKCQLWMWRTPVCVCQFWWKLLFYELCKIHISIDMWNSCVLHERPLLITFDFVCDFEESEGHKCVSVFIETIYFVNYHINYCIHTLKPTNICIAVSIVYHPTINHIYLIN